MLSFNKKILLFSAVFILAIPLVGLLYYKRTHSKYIPLPPRPEAVITIIPGWNLRQVAEHLVKQGLASTTEDVFTLTGKPAVDYRITKATLSKIEDLKILADKPGYVSYEGYLAPDTYRVFKDASVLDILKKLVEQREKEITEDIWSDIKESGHSFYEILTMASILEDEVRNPDDKAKVADILWRRYKNNWALQVDSSVHYAINKQGVLVTTKKERAYDSLWNTYKYPGLPLGPIANPGLVSIKAALYPEKNNYWYFLTGKDGAVYYARTLDEHNYNRQKYLR